MPKKKIIFVINYFYPDVASTAQLMTDLISDLQNEFEITVVAAQPNYAGEHVQVNRIFEKDYYENVKVIRIKLPYVNKLSKLSRVRYIFSYLLLALSATLLERNVDVIYTISQPPIIGGLIGTIGKLIKRKKHVYNIQDFNPEQAAVVKYTGNRIVYYLARSLDKINCKLADEVIVVGNDMAETLKNRFNNKKIPKNTVINNWTNEDEIVPLSGSTTEIKEFKEKYNLIDKFIVMYSGNLGLFYDLENIISLTKDFKDNPDIVFLFIGEGALKEKMKMYVDDNNLENVIFLPYQPMELLKYSLNVADIHLVVNQKGIKGISVPSKIYGVMAAGKPILGVLEKGSEGYNLISNSGCGIIVEPKDYKGIKDCINYLSKMEKAKLREIGLKGRVYLEENLTKNVSINKYREVLRNL